MTGSFVVTGSFRGSRGVCNRQRALSLSFHDRACAPGLYRATRAYYQALGYGAPYRWAQFDHVPFTPLRKPVSQAVIGIVTTAAPYRRGLGDQGWPGSRVISAQKANTANAFSLPGLALSTANLFSAVQPGGSLFGLQFSNPVNTEVAYRGPSANIGTVNDPMVGGKIGGVNVFGGGLPLYAADGALLGAVACERRQFLRRPQHRLEAPQRPRSGPPARRSQRHQ